MAGKLLNTSAALGLFFTGSSCRDLSIAEHHRPFRKLRDVRLVRHQHNRQPAVIQVLKDLHDLH